jgi:hypothetical protein
LIILIIGLVLSVVLSIYNLVKKTAPIKASICEIVLLLFYIIHLLYLVYLLYILYNYITKELSEKKKYLKETFLVKFLDKFFSI